MRIKAVEQNERLASVIVKIISRGRENSPSRAMSEKAWASYIGSSKMHCSAVPPYAIQLYLNFLHSNMFPNRKAVVHMAEKAKRVQMAADNQRCCSWWLKILDDDQPDRTR